MENLKEKTIGEYVAQDYKTAAVFQKYNIDFCCRGGRTIDEVCEKKQISKDELLSSLDKVLNATTGGSIDYKSWPIDLLVDYIEKKHHRYVEANIPVLMGFLEKLCKVHGERHPELFEIAEEFAASSHELTAHMKKEELIVFPHIRKMVNAKLTGQELNSPHFGSIQNPIEMMMIDHDNEGVRFRKIAAMTDNYTAPADGCTTYRVAFSLLKEYEEDLHLHIHLENNIAFKEAIKMEKEFAAKAV